MNQPHKVTLVLNSDYGDKLASLAESSHVWVVDSIANRSAAAEYWSRNPKHRVEAGITTFQSSANESPLESCLKMLDTIDLHHGQYSSNPPYSIFEVIGCPLSKAVKSSIEAFGFRNFEATAEGFRARR